MYSYTPCLINDEAILLVNGEAILYDCFVLLNVCMKYFAIFEGLMEFNFNHSYSWIMIVFKLLMLYSFMQQYMLLLIFIINTVIL